MRYLQGLAAVAAALALGGCFNLGTKPSEITPAFVPASQYQNESCQQLDVDRGALYRRESLLTTAQDQRRHSNKVQAFWVGFGNGDGVGAGELAQVKGEILAVEKERSTKGCGGAVVYGAGGQVVASGWPLPMPQFDVRAGCQSAGGDLNACINAEQAAHTWLASHTTSVQTAGQCTTFAQPSQSYTLIKACVQQREGTAR